MFSGGWLSSSESHLCLQQSCYESRSGSGRDQLRVAGRVRLGGEGLSFLLHPWLGPGAVSGSEEGDRGRSRALLKSVKGGSPPAPTLSLPVPRACLSESAGLPSSGDR